MEKDDNTDLLFKIYRQLTNNIHRFIINESHHSVQHKMAAFNSMFHLAMSIPMKNENHAELKYIYETTGLNGYAR
jgi:predicted metal-dependent hydrolase